MCIQTEELLVEMFVRALLCWATFATYAVEDTRTMAVSTGYTHIIYNYYSSGAHNLTCYFHLLVIDVVKD